jgi:lipoprotein-anchoring transpeptidase ErfK/SrfK
VTRRLPAVLAVLLVLLAAAGGTFAWADHKASGRLADGISVAGVDVGGLTEDAAVAKLESELGTAARRPLRLKVADRTFRLSAERAGVQLALRDAVRRAYRESRDGSLPERAWRELTGGSVRHDEPAAATVDRAAVDRFVARIDHTVARAAREASLELTVSEVTTTPSRAGRELVGAKRLADRIERHLTDPRGKRRLAAEVETIEPKTSTDDLWENQPVAVTVSLSERMVRVFDKGELATTYNVAVGEPRYPTPPGEFTVQGMQVDPPWNVPQSDWAGDLAGQTIPGGDPANPLVARWIGFNGSVGFHGTASIGSIGSAASHGCVRMAPGDVIELYDRVAVGTPVLVA